MRGIHLIVLGVLLIYLIGCSTTNVKKQELQIQQLQTHIHYLESEISRQSEEISQLRNELIQPPRLAYNPLDDYEDLVEATAVDEDAISPSPSEIQKALKKAGFYQGSVDGKIGPKTNEAIRVFQKKNKLKPDGVVGKMTWSELKRYLE